MYLGVDDHEVKTLPQQSHGRCSYGRRQGWLSTSPNIPAGHRTTAYLPEHSPSWPFWERCCTPVPGKELCAIQELPAGLMLVPYMAQKAVVSSTATNHQPQQSQSFQVQVPPFHSSCGSLRVLSSSPWWLEAELIPAWRWSEGRWPRSSHFLARDLVTAFSQHDQTS